MTHYSNCLFAIFDTTVIKISEFTLYYQPDNKMGLLVAKVERS